MGRADDLAHDKRLPGSYRYRLREVQRLSHEVLDERFAAYASIDQRAEFGIEHDQFVQQERRDRLVLEAAGTDEGFIDGWQVVPGLIKRRANSVEITQRREELECARQHAFTVKQPQQPVGAGPEKALAHLRLHDRA